MLTDLNAFYSSVPIEELQKILGKHLHFHFGYFSGKEELEFGLRQTVRNFYPHINNGSRVLDAGCGWGGPAKMLIKEKDCLVRGLTVSLPQAVYCQSLGIDACLHDLENEDVKEEYDVIFMLEVLEHIRDKARLLKRLRHHAPLLILSTSCVSKDYNESHIRFGGSLNFCTEDEIERYLYDAGWDIIYKKNRRLESRQTIVHWQKNLDKVYGKQQPLGFLKNLRKLTEIYFQEPDLWCNTFPLIDIVAI